MNATRFRTHTCGELRAAHSGKPVTLAGSIDRVLGEGAIELRDRHGRTRVALPKIVSKELTDAWAGLAPEAVAQIAGTVISRAKADPSLETGEVEVVAKTVTVFSSAEPLPPAFASEELSLEDKLRHRPLYLRRPVMQKRLQFRSRLFLEIRNLLASESFVEVETPLLAPWTKEATQSYIVPSGNGRAFALPGTPQAYKQLLIAGGVDRYFQIARCFRKEDELTPERQPEFTTLDLEMAFADEEDVLRVADRLVQHLWKTVVGKEIAAPRRLTHEEALLWFGTERPDTRFELEIRDLTALAAKLDIPAYREVVFSPNGAVRGLRIPGAAMKISDQDLDATLKRATGKAPEARATWLKVAASVNSRGPATKLLEAKGQPEVLRSLDAEPTDVVLLFDSKKKYAAAAAAGAARTALARALGLVDEQKHALVWVTQFPFFRYVPEDEAWAAARHPFTQPREEDVPLIDADKHRVRTKAYDLVLNGVELGAGSIRNHDMRLQRKIFDMFEYKPEEVAGRYGRILDAFRFGVPPLGGLALGLDRLLAALHGTDAIDEVIAFPKDREGRDLLLESPSEIDADFVKSSLGV